MEDKKNILIVENDSVLCDTLAKKLENNGYLVNKAQDGIIAMEKMRIVQPDCILLDILMPRKNGIEVLQELHADPVLGKIPVIIISNSGQPVDMKLARELGAVDFLIKAIFDPEEVLKKVQNALSVSEMVSKREYGAHVSVAETGTVKSQLQNMSANATTTTSLSDKSSFVFIVDVLVVEDDDFLVNLLARKLSSEDFNVRKAVNAEETFAVLAECKPKIILLDLILPGVSGFEILSRIKADPKTADIPVIILSNLGQKEDMEKAMSLGADAFMVKAHFTLDEIMTKIHSVGKF